jgi:hypothetical protein
MNPTFPKPQYQKVESSFAIYMFRTTTLRGRTLSPSLILTHDLLVYSSLFLSNCLPALRMTNQELPLKVLQNAGHFYELVWCELVGWELVVGLN